MIATIDHPHLLTEIADACGEETASRLARRWGGRLVSIPTTPRPGIRAEIGEAGAAWLVKHFGGQRIAVPHGPISGSEALSRRIIELSYTKSSAVIAAELGIALQTVRRTLLGSHDAIGHV